ncbi:MULTISPECIES: hypothetical protein [Pseudomonas]|uniref:hypothetical protein n=1 Tax=Pseudomonas TaxID=286 RepID=UPI000C88DB28|nr:MULTISPECIES: hypothetical protein [Pseudomonas]PMY40116.1 hypothetical protein C1Y36_24180 [Pseudomonas sp. FW306-2-2C-D06C]PYC41839.1 hypothetical protein DMW99_00300 [Pseudomonas chlororaphis]
MELLKTIKGEWAVISTAPFTFLILAALMSAAAYFVARWRYTAIIDEAKAKQETLTERLHLRSEQVESYREKASKYDQMLTEVVDSGTTELRDKALRLVADIREFVGRFKRLERSDLEDRFFETTHIGTDFKSDLQWERQTQALINNTLERNGEYDRRFKIEAIILRDELRSRLPDYKPDGVRPLLYEKPTNAIGFSSVADDLEKMAKLLK